MTLMSTRRRPGLDGCEGRLALAVADANWFTTENLFREIERDDVSTLLLKCMDYRNAWQRGSRPWAWGGALTRSVPGLWRRDLVLPSGWMKRFPRLGMRPIASAIRRWRLADGLDGRLALVMTYPHYLYLRDLIWPERSVYYNIDDYARYWPRCADRVRELEHRAVRESDLTICVSRLRAEELRAAVPEASDRIRHLPHGAPSVSLAEHPWDRPAPAPDDLAALPRPLLGYVGSMEDRIDWKLLTRLSEALPRASIVLIGRLAAERTGAWCRRSRALPGATQCARAGVAAAGADPCVQSRLRRLPDPLRGRAPVQPRVQPDEDHGLHGLGTADRLDGPARVPTLHSPVPRRRRRRRLHRRRPRDSRRGLRRRPRRQSL